MAHCNTCPTPACTFHSILEQPLLTTTPMLTLLLVIALLTVISWSSLLDTLLHSSNHTLDRRVTWSPDCTAPQRQLLHNILSIDVQLLAQRAVTALRPRHRSRHDQQKFFDYFDDIRDVQTQRAAVQIRFQVAVLSRGRDSLYRRARVFCTDRDNICGLRWPRTDLIGFIRAHEDVEGGEDELRSIQLCPRFWELPRTVPETERDDMAGALLWFFLMLRWRILDDVHWGFPDDLHHLARFSRREGFQRYRRPQDVIYRMVAFARALHGWEPSGYAWGRSIVERGLSRK